MKAPVKWILSLTGLLAVIAVVLLSRWTPLFVTRGAPVVPRFLADLPMPDEEAPYAVIDAREGAFPLAAVRLFSDEATLLPFGSSPVGAFLPILGGADASALVLTERENGLTLYGAFSLRDGEIEDLRRMTVPRAWQDHLSRPACSSMDSGENAGEGRYQIDARNMSAPLYLELDLEKRAAYISDSLFDMELMRETRSGRMSGITRAWTDYGGWGGHLSLSDGGLLARLSAENFAQPVQPDQPVRPVKAEVRWNIAEPGPRDRTLSETVLGGRAEWRLRDLRAAVGETFLASLKPRDWSGDALFLPEPLILSFGFNLPDPGKNTEALPVLLRGVAATLGRMLLKPSEVRNILTGPFALSLGGRTQVLWFDLPGVALDLPGRGQAGNRLIDRFWADTFFGATPSPIEGYSYGGGVDLPFTVMAASNASTAVIGLTMPDVERNAEVADLLKGEPTCLGWLFVDLPKLGSALSEMPTFNAILNHEEGLPMEEDATRALRDAMTRLGRFFISFETANNGHALWYD